MDKDKSYVWYVGYGSNLSRQRFLCYIVGGKPAYGFESAIPASGCADKSLPLEDRPIVIPHSLYFALPDGKQSTSNWGIGGVAFLSADKTDDICLARMWKVSQEQYEDIRRQEGRSWYDKEIKIGEADGFPIVTITNSRSLNVRSPSEGYLKTIIEGLKEKFHMESCAVANYLLVKKGIAEACTEQAIRNLYEQ